MPARERSFRLEAVVLRHQDWGEADRLLTLFSRELGKIRAIAKGVRKMHSRKAGHLEPFTRVSLLVARGRDMYIVTQAETLDACLPLSESLETFGQASYVVELLDRFTYEEGENRALYRLLVETLVRLENGAPPPLVLHFYELRLLDLVGYRPQLFSCAKCQEEIKAQDQYFSSELGGALCPSCGKDYPGATPVSLNTLKYLRHLQRSSYSQASRATIPPAAGREMEALLERYLTYLLERALNTPRVLRRLIQPPKTA